MVLATFWRFATRGLAALITAALLIGSPASAFPYEAWTSGIGKDIDLGSAETQFCFLAGIKGSWEPGASAYVRIVNGHWVVGGTHSPTPKVFSVWAFCRQNKAFGTSASDVHWVSPEFVRPASGCHGAPVKAWWGDAVTAISGFKAGLATTTDFVFVSQSAKPYEPSVMEGMSCANGFTAAATSYFWGQPHSGKTLTYVGPNGSGDVYAAGQWDATGQSNKPLSDYATTQCYLTVLAGSWSGDGYVGLDDHQGKVWTLWAPTDGKLKVSATCVRLQP